METIEEFETFVRDRVVAFIWVCPKRFLLVN